MCCTKLWVEVEQWEDEGVYPVFLLSVKRAPADEVVQEERDEEKTCVDRMGVVTILPFLCLSTPFFSINSISSNVEFCHQVDVCEGVEGGQENIEN